MKLKIKPFSEFWLDCLSTIFFTVLLSDESIDDYIVCINDYKYDITNEQTKTGIRFKSINIFFNLSPFSERYLVNKECINMKCEEDIITKLKENLDKNKIILLGVDMFYWVSDSLHWHRNHIQHEALIIGYDDEASIFYALDSGGTEGYHEYKLSYDSVVLAAKSFSGDSYIFDIETNLEEIKFTRSNVEEYARKTIESIDEIIKNIDVIWNINGFEEDDIDYFCDIVATHLYAFENRQIANMLLFQKAFIYNDEINKHDIEKEFEKLYLQFTIHKNVFRKSCVSRSINKRIDDYKEETIKLFKKEREIWNCFLNDKEYKYIK